MDAEKLGELERLVWEIKTLKSIRDEAAHKIWAVSGSRIAFSNYHLSRDESQAQIGFYTVSELNDLARYAPYLSERALDLVSECDCSAFR